MKTVIETDAFGGTRGTGKADVAVCSNPIDTDVLLARCMGKRSFALSLLAELEATGSKRIAEIRRLASDAEFDAVTEAAHSLKGSVAILAAEPLRATAAAIEAAGQARAGEQLEELIRQLDAEMQRCLNFIREFRANPNDPAAKGLSPGKR